MKKLGIILPILIVAGFLGFYLLKKVDESSYQAPDTTNGRKVYTTHCMSCHGEKGVGNGIASKSLEVKPDSIYEELNNPLGFKSELINSVLDGDNGQGGLMPAFRGILSEEDINDAFAYIIEQNQ